MFVEGTGLRWFFKNEGCEIRFTALRLS